MNKIESPKSVGVRKVQVMNPIRIKDNSIKSQNSKPKEEKKNDK